MFLFPNMNVSIDDFRSELEEKRIFLYGKCSSSKTPKDRRFHCLIRFFRLDDFDLMEMISLRRFGDAGRVEIRKRLFQSTNSLEFGNISYGDISYVV